MSENPSSPGLHPSYFELDRMYLESSAAAPDHGPWDAHTQQCTPCQQYLGQLRVQGDSALPSWVRAQRVAQAAAPLASFWQRLWQWLKRPAALGPALLAGSAAVLLIVALRADLPISRGSDPVTSKGGPFVGVYIKRGERVARWDGHSPLQPRDRIRLEVAGAGFPYVTVAFAQAAGIKVLYSGELPAAAPTQLPASWQLDSQGEREVLFILLSGQPLPANAIDIEQLKKDDRVWVRELVLRKVQLP